MIYSEFKALMKDLSDVFDEKNFPIPRVKLIWDQVKDLDAYQFKKIVDHFIGNTNIKYPPLVKDFIEAVNEQQQKHFENKINTFASNIINSPKSNGNALRELLKSTGSNNLLDLIKKKNK